LIDSIIEEISLVENVLSTRGERHHLSF